MGGFAGSTGMGDMVQLYYNLKKIKENSERQRGTRTFHTEPSTQSTGHRAVWFGGKVKWNRTRGCLAHGDVPHSVCPSSGGPQMSLLSAKLVQYCLLQIFSYTTSGLYFKLTCVFLHYLGKKEWIFTVPTTSVCLSTWIFLHSQITLDRQLLLLLTVVFAACPHSFRQGQHSSHSFSVPAACPCTNSQQCLLTSQTVRTRQVLKKQSDEDVKAGDLREYKVKGQREVSEGCTTYGDVAGSRSWLGAFPAFLRGWTVTPSVLCYFLLHCFCQGPS